MNWYPLLGSENKKIKQDDEGRLEISGLDIDVDLQPKGISDVEVIQEEGYGEVGEFITVFDTQDACYIDDLHFMSDSGDAVPFFELYSYTGEIQEYLKNIRLHRDVGQMFDAPRLDRIIESGGETSLWKVNKINEDIWNMYFKKPLFAPHGIRIRVQVAGEGGKYAMQALVVRTS